MDLYARLDGDIAIAAIEKSFYPLRANQTVGFLTTFGISEELLNPSHFLPSLFCAITSPRGVGSKTTEINPSCSMRNAASRTVLR